MAHNFIISIVAFFFDDADKSLKEDLDLENRASEQKNLLGR